MRQALDKMRQYDDYMNANDWKELINDKKWNVLI